MCDFICDTDAFSTCGETFKIQSVVFNCNSQKIAYLLKYRTCGEAPYFGKAKTKFRARFDKIKAHTDPVEKNVKYHSNVFRNIMGNTVIMGLMIGSSH